MSRTIAQSALPAGPWDAEPPKSDAGVRLVPFPDVIVADLRWHLQCFAQDGDDGLVFTSPTGTPLRHSNFYRRAWLKAVKAAGLSGVHFHDLRHTGNALTADAGASLRELMERMGHSSARAALIYLHSTSERQRKLADAVGRQARAELRKTRNPSGVDSQSGTKVARRRKPAS
jgi:integrase